MLRRLGCHLGTAAQEKYPPALLLRPRQKTRYQVRACDAGRQDPAKPARGPDDRLAVAEDQVRVDKDTAQFVVPLRLYQKIDVRGDDIMRASVCDHRFDAVDRASERDRMEGNAQDGDERFHRGRRGMGLDGVRHPNPTATLGWVAVGSQTQTRRHDAARCRITGWTPTYTDADGRLFWAPSMTLLRFLVRYSPAMVIWTSARRS